MSARRYFSLSEVNQALPDVRDILRRMILLRGQLRQPHERLVEAGYEPSLDDITHGPDANSDMSDSARRDNEMYHGLAELLLEELARLKETGCIIRDVEAGLVEWHSQTEGRDILLCWQLGEERVSWHELETSFAARRPVEELSEASEAP